LETVMETLIRDIRYGVRLLLKHPGFTVAAVLTLAVGIGANTAIFSIVHAVVLQPLPFHDPQQLVMVWESDRNGKRNNVGYPTFNDWRAQNQSFEAMSAVADWNPTLAGAGEPQALVGSRVTADFFRVLGVKPTYGQDFTADDDRPDAPRVVIISYGLWARSFNHDRSLIGKTIQLSGIERTVVGIMPPDFQPLLSPNNKRVDVWRPLGYAGEVPPACRSCRHLRAVGRIRQGVTQAQAQAELAIIQQRIVNDHRSDYSTSGIALQPLQEQFSGQSGPILFVLWGAVGFVMLIACANVANLMLARTTSRRKEFVLRRALGAGRARILAQVLTESMLLAFAGGALGVLLAMLGTEWLVSLAPSEISRIEQAQMSPIVLSFALGLSVLTSVLFGLWPAITAGRTDLQQDLKQGSRTSASLANRWLRNALVITDVALAMILLAGAGLMLKSMAHLLDVPSGMIPHNVLTMKLSLFGPEYAGKDGNARVLGVYRQALERVSTLPGVSSAGAVSQLPLGGDFDMYGVRIKDKPVANPEDVPSAFRYGITPGYIEALGIPLQRGRTITPHDDETSQPVVLINELLATRTWPDEDPLGKLVKMGGPDKPWRMVVGVVGNVRHEGLDQPQKMQLYVPEAQWPDPDSDMVMTIRTNADPSAMAGPAREAIWSISRNVRITEVASMDKVIGSSLAQRRFPMMLLGMFALAAILLAALGLYGLMAYSVTQRTVEIGVRMALGARPREVLSLVLRQGLYLIAIGIAFGLAGTLALRGLIRGLLFEVTATDPSTLILVALLLTAVALIACYLPARRATKVDPLVALRYE
jgi:putative ABC transport system permease protein